MRRLHHTKPVTPGTPLLLSALSRLTRCLLLAVAVGLAPVAQSLSPVQAIAQEPAWFLRHGLPAGSELERYMRVLQVAGVSPVVPWTVRGFTAGELPGLVPSSADHPWRDRVDLSMPNGDELEWGWTRQQAGIYFNSAYPFGDHDGALWAGRGASGRASAGAFFRWNRIHLRVDPEVWWSQNAEFELADNGLRGDAMFRDARRSAGIDLPQRFGSTAVAGLAPGSTQLTVALSGLTLGISGAAQTWGPGHQYQVLMGTNAGGFPHIFLQSSGPLNIGIGQVSARLVVGALDQSRWSPVQSGELRRFLSGAVLTFSPDILSGLEVGVERIVHGVWPRGGPGFGQILRPFSGGVSVGYSDGNLREENQLAGAFARWVVPQVGVEVWAEVVRDDFARDIRHYLLEPDDLLARSLGIQRVLGLSDGKLLALRGEVLSAETHHGEREDRFRFSPTSASPLPLYPNGGVRQGHTLRGQLLASPAAYGGSAVTVGADLFTRSGRWTLDLFRELRQDWITSMPGGGTDIADVLYGIRVERVYFGDGFELRGTVVPAVNLNRNVIQGNDVFNLNLAFGLLGLPW